MLKGGEVSEFVARLTTKALLALAAVFVFAAISLLRHGLVGDYLFLLVGSIFSAAAIVAYAFSAFAPKGRKSWLLAGIAFSGFIPYLFGSYLVFYRGFWRLKDLFATFSMLTIFKAACFVLIGYMVVSGIYKITEFVRMVDKGKIIIE